MGRTVRVVVLTLFYWPIALFLLALSLMPECFAEVVACEATKRTTAAVIFGCAAAFYALLLLGILRGRSRFYWLVLVTGIAIIVALFLAGMGIF